MMQIYYTRGELYKFSLEVKLTSWLSRRPAVFFFHCSVRGEKFWRRRCSNMCDVWNCGRVRCFFHASAGMSSTWMGSSSCKSLRLQ